MNSFVPRFVVLCLLAKLLSSLSSDHCLVNNDVIAPTSWRHLEHAHSIVHTSSMEQQHPPTAATALLPCKHRKGTVETAKERQERLQRAAQAYQQAAQTSAQAAARSNAPAVVVRPPPRPAGTALQQAAQKQQQAQDRRSSSPAALLPSVEVGAACCCQNNVVYAPVCCLWCALHVLLDQLVPSVKLHVCVPHAVYVDCLMGCQRGSFLSCTLVNTLCLLDVHTYT